MTDRLLNMMNMIDTQITTENRYFKNEDIIIDMLKSSIYLRYQLIMLQKSFDNDILEEVLSFTQKTLDFDAMNTLNAILFQLDEVITLSGAVPYTTNPKESFDPSRHNIIVAPLPCTQKELSGKIAKSLFPGYKRNGITITKEYVETFMS